MVTPFALQRAYRFNPYRKAHLYLFDKPEVGAHLAPPMGELSAQPTERALSAPYGGHLSHRERQEWLCCQSVNF